MKTLIFILVFSFPIIVVAQSEKDVFTTPDITWLGLDFSKTKCFGDFTVYANAGLVTGQKMKDDYFPAWNELILKEKEKYNLKEAYKKTDLLYDITEVSTRNAAVNSDAIFSKNSAEKNMLTKNDIAQIVQQYTLEKKGLGLVYIVDSFDKTGNKGTIWVTFIDMGTKTVLLTQRFSGKPGGIGIRNYWASAIHEIIKQSGKEYSKWQKAVK